MLSKGIKIQVAEEIMLTMAEIFKLLGSLFRMIPRYSEYKMISDIISATC